MKISLAIHFPLCLSRHFQLFFSTLDEFLDIFNIFFDPCYARVGKYGENVSKFVACQKIRRKYLNKHSGKWIAWLKFITARLYKYKTYINSYSCAQAKSAF